jgi:Sybindin-like family
MIDFENAINWVSDMYQALQSIYNQLFIDYVVRNPLFKYSPDSAFDSPLFTTKLEEYLRNYGLPGSGLR